LVHESDLPSGYADATISRQIQEAEDHEKTMRRYRRNIAKYGGDKGRALAETFPTTNE